MRWAAPAVLLCRFLVLALLAFGCGGAPPRGAPAAAPPQPGEPVSLEAVSFDFVPKRTRARVGAELKFRVRNTSGIGHNLTVLHPDGKVAGSVDVESGKSAELSVRLPRAGDYVIYCDKFLHRTFGMEGVVEAR